MRKRRIKYIKSYSKMNYNDMNNNYNYYSNNMNNNNADMLFILVIIYLIINLVLKFLSTLIVMVDLYTMD